MMESNVIELLYDVRSRIWLVSIIVPLKIDPPITVPPKIVPSKIVPGPK